MRIFMRHRPELPALCIGVVLQQLLKFLAEPIVGARAIDFHLDDEPGMRIGGTGTCGVTNSQGAGWLAIPTLDVHSRAKVGFRLQSQVLHGQLDQLSRVARITVEIDPLDLLALVEIVG